MHRPIGRCRPYWHAPSHTLVCVYAGVTWQPVTANKFAFILNHFCRYIGKRDAQAQLDGLMEEVNRRKTCLEALERRAVAAALVEERMRYCLLVGCLKPVAVSMESCV